MSVGGTLAAARARAGLTLEQVADSTRIRRTLIDNIEHDDFHACGGDFYARGHIKAIAHAVHTDPAPLLAEFDGDHQDADLPTASGVLDTAHVESAQRSAVGFRPNWSVAMLVALVAVLAVGGFQLLSGGGGTAGADASGARATAGSDVGAGTETAGPTETSTPEPSSAPSDAIASVPQRDVTVVISAVDGRSWVSATGKDAGLLYQDVLGSGSEQTVTDDRQVKLVVGNAGAVRLLVNGHDVGAPGGVGEVVRLTFGPGDPAAATG